VQFQAWVPGPDVRVHVVGDDTFAARVATPATDYRYPDRSGAPAPQVTRLEISDGLAERCVVLTQRLGLEFAGIDLRMPPDREPVCLEVNPSPRTRIMSKPRICLSPPPWRATWQAPEPKPGIAAHARRPRKQPLRDRRCLLEQPLFGVAGEG
jgi:hypothetical protein